MCIDSRRLNVNVKRMITMDTKNINTNKTPTNGDTGQAPKKSISTFPFQICQKPRLRQSNDHLVRI